MTPEQFTERVIELAGWPVRLTSYRLGDQYYCKADNLSPGAWLARAHAPTQAAAEEKVLEQARRLLSRTPPPLAARREPQGGSMHQPNEIVFYDRHCGLCRRAVKFVLNRDHSGTPFRFAPLQRTDLPQSIIVETCDGALLTRSTAWAYILRRLGPGWKVIAALITLIPQPLRDAVYEFIARIRYRLFGRRDDHEPSPTATSTSSPRTRTG